TKLTASTVYPNKDHTVTKGPPEVTNWPKKPHVTTESYAVSITVCHMTVTHVVPPKETHPVAIPPVHPGNGTWTPPKPQTPKETHPAKPPAPQPPKETQPG
ncbi:hypothetical protein H9Q69_014440, partial [Fusarium xylarioides]